MSPLDMPGSLALVGLKNCGNVRPNTVASVAGTTDLTDGVGGAYAVTTVSGALAITAFKLPSGYKGLFCLLPTGAFTGATGGTWADDGTTLTLPIGKAFTAVVQRALLFVSDGLLAYPIA